EHAADDPALEARAHVVDDVAVRVGDDLADRRRRVDADQADGRDLEPGFLTDLAHDRLTDRLARLDATAWESPEAIVAPAVEEKAVGREDDRRHAGADHHAATVRMGAATGKLSALSCRSRALLWTPRRG